MSRNTRRDRDYLEAYEAFLDAFFALERILEQEMREEQGLALSWYDVLITLHRAPDRRLRLQDLSRQVALSTSRISRLVPSMEQAGYVVREPDPKDRRGIYAVLTEAGTARLRTASKTHLRGVKAHFGRYLEKGEAEVVTKVFSKIVRAGWKRLGME